MSLLATFPLDPLGLILDCLDGRSICMLWLTGDLRVQRNVVKAARRVEVSWNRAPHHLGPLAASKLHELTDLSLVIKPQCYAYDFLRPNWNWLPASLEKLKISIDWTSDTCELFFKTIHRLPNLTCLETMVLSVDVKGKPAILDLLPRTLKILRLEGTSPSLQRSQPLNWSWKLLSRLPPSLEVLELGNSAFTPFDFDSDIKIPSLRILTLSAIPLQQLCLLDPSIREIRGPAQWIPDEVWKHSKLPPLEALSISIQSIFDWSVLPSSLTWIHIKDLHNCNIDGIAEYCPLISHISCDRVVNVTIGILPQTLEKLVLSGDEIIIDPAALILPNLKHLEILPIAAELYWAPTLQVLKISILDHQLCAALAYIPNLTTLECRYARQVTLPTYSSLLPTTLKTLVVPGWRVESLVLPPALTVLKMPVPVGPSLGESEDPVIQMTEAIEEALTRIGEIPSGTLSCLVWSDFPQSDLELCGIISDCSHLRQLSLGSPSRSVPQAVLKFLHFCPLLEEVQFYFSQCLDVSNLKLFFGLHSLQKLSLSANNTGAAMYRATILSILPHINVWVKSFYDFI